jgi:hypothetical protein
MVSAICLSFSADSAPVRPRFVNLSLVLNLRTSAAGGLGVGRCYKPRARIRWIGSRKRVLRVHNDDRDKGDRKLYFTVCGNRLHMRYRRDPKSGVGILDIGRFTRAPFANSLANIDLNDRFERSIRTK